MHPLANPPADPKQGQMYFNTGNKKLYYYDNTKWVALNDIDLSNYVTTTQLNDGLNKKLDKKTAGDVLAQAGIEPSVRGEKLGIDEFAAIANTLHEIGIK